MTAPSEAEGSRDDLRSRGLYGRGSGWFSDRQLSSTISSELTFAPSYAEMMSVDLRRISVAIRELGEGGLWRIAETGGDPVPVSALMLDIRKGRPAELRMAVAKALCAHCVEVLGLREDRLNVEFTQHSGDEMYHPALGGYSPDWTPEEG